MRLVRIILLFLSSHIVKSQVKDLKIEGILINQNGPLVNATIKVYTLDSLYDTKRTDKKGVFSISLSLGENYFIEFGKLKHFSRWVAYETEGVVAQQIHPGFKFKPWEVYLLEEDHNLRPMENTIKAGRVFFDETESVFSWDTEGAYIPKELILNRKQLSISDNSKYNREELYAASKDLAKDEVLDNTKEVGTVKIISEEVFPQFSRQVYLLETESQELTFSKVNHKWGGTFYFKEELPIKEFEFNRLLLGELFVGRN